MPDDAMIGHNSPPTDAEILKEKLDEATKKLRSKLTEIKKADANLPEACKDEETAEKLTKYIKQCGQLDAAFEDERKKQKKPFDEAGKAVQNYFNPLQEAAGASKKKATGLLTAYQVEQERIAREKAEAARKAAEEEARRRAEESAAKGVPEPEPEPEQLKQEAPRTRDLETGATASIRTETVISITDPIALLKSVAAGEQPIEWVSFDKRAILKAVKDFGLKPGSTDIPGVTITEKKTSIVR